MQKRIYNLGQDNLFDLICRFGIPATIGLLINASYNFVDRIFIGQGVGALGLAALNISFPAFVIQMALGMMIGVGGSVNFSVSLGQGKKEKAERILTLSALFAFVVGILYTVIHIVWLKPILKLYGASDEILPYAIDYASILLLGSFLLISCISINNFIRACSHPKTAMMTLLCGAVTNIFLDWIFIFKCGWGIKGGALATVISQFISFTWAVSFFFSKRSPFHFKLKYLRINYKFISAICIVGFAPFSIQICNGFVQMVFNNSLVKYGGSLAVSALGISAATMMLLFMPIIGLGEGAQPVMGFNLGAKQYKRVMKAYRILILMTTIWGCIGWCIVQCLAPQIVSLFTKDNMDLIQLGSKALKFMGLAMPLIAFSISTTYMLQATKNPKMAIFLSLARQLIFLIPFVCILPRFFGVMGIFYSLPCADTVAFLFTLPVYFHENRKYKRLILSKEKN